MTSSNEITFEPDELFGEQEQDPVQHGQAGAAADTTGEPMHALANNGPLKQLIDNNFLQYASYVIRDRAIPHLDDGLKPVQRRILYSLHENDDGKFIKVANIVGHCMQYHPHGDASIGDALVTLTNRRYLIEGQGNFGNIHTGDPAAAARYIECRLTDLARNEVFHDELTNFLPSYDGRRKEPVTLPVKLPLLLMLGTEGIAVGLSTRVLPHNFRELIEAQIAVLRKKKFKLYPDFQQGGLMDASEYDKGNGKVKLRAVIEQRDDTTLVIREIPYGTTTESLIASIEDAARKKKIHIKSIRDYTGEQIEIEIQLAREQSPDKTIQTLYAFTHCEISVSVHAVVIHNNRPAEMDVDAILRHNTDRLLKILRRELNAERKKLLEDIHRRTLVRIFVENRIYKDIEECKTADAVHKAVRDGLSPFRDELPRDITRQDIEMLLGIPIRRISRFDIEKSRREVEKLRKEIERIEKNLGNLTAYTIRYLQNLLKKYGDAYPRRTQLQTFREVAIRRLTASELCMRLDTEKGYIGTEIEGEALFECSSLDRVMMVWKDGRYKMMPPPGKHFVGEDFLYAAVYDRNRIMTMVYKDEAITYIKRFKFGGAIMNRDYRCTPEHAEVLFFADNDPDTLYVKYRKAKRQRINQQVFHPRKQSAKNVKAKGAQMTVKKIRSIQTHKPRNWDRQENPSGALIDFT